MFSLKCQNLSLLVLVYRNSTGWKVTTNPVAASLFGQQKVSSRGEAMADCRQREREKKVDYGVRRKQKKRKRRGNDWVHEPTVRNHGVESSCASI